MSEIHFESVTELMSRLDAREIGARELLDHFLDRVERHNPAITRSSGRTPTARGRKPTLRTGAARRGRTAAPWMACR